MTTTTPHSAAPGRRVLFIVAGMMHFRVEFHQYLRKSLADMGIHYDVAYSDASAHLTGRDDTRTLDFGEKIGSRWFTLGPATLCWQYALRKARSYDLVIVMQENKYLINYVLQTLRHVGGPKVAFYGHGRNMQADGGLRERFKRLWINNVDWWFAYTGMSEKLVVASGYPPAKITNVENAYDTQSLYKEVQSVTAEEIEDFRKRFGITSSNIGIYIGALYKEKRVAFMIDSAKKIRELVPDFEFIVIGGGTDRHLMDDAATQHAWLHALPPTFGRDKAIALKMSKVFLLPGLVGLAILDTFAAGVPMVTVDYPYHSPEIDYLKDGKNGLIVTPGNDVELYARTVAGLLQNEPYRAQLAAAALADAARYSAEHMANNFARGIQQALNEA